MSALDSQGAAPAGALDLDAIRVRHESLLGDEDTTVRGLATEGLALLAALDESRAEVAHVTATRDGMVAFEIAKWHGLCDMQEKALASVTAEVERLRAQDAFRLASVKAALRKAESNVKEAQSGVPSPRRSELMAAAMAARHVLDQVIALLGGAS